MQVAALALQTLSLPDALLRYFWLAAIIGFPVALLFGWYYEITAGGIRRTPSGSSPDSETLSLKIPDYLIISAVAIVAAVVAAGIFDRARIESDSLIYDPASIAVLPLTDLSGDEDQAYFSAGMHDALIASLSKIGSLRVISRRSASSVDASLTTSGVGRILGVRNIIEGSVTREGSRVRIIVQLVDAANDAQIWAGNFDRELTGILGLQNDIANSIAEAIDIRLSEEDRSELARQPIVDSASYDAYLRAMYRIHDDSNLVRREGIAILKNAVESDPDNASLHAGLAYGYALLGHSPFPEGMYPASILSAARALALDMIDRTLEISPNHAVALMVQSRTDVEMDEFESALAASSRISDHPMWGFMHGSTLAMSGDEDGARAALATIEKSPRFVIPLMISHASLDDVDETFAWLEVARDVKLPLYPWFVTWFPQLSGFRDDPRMYALAKEIGLEHILDKVYAE